MPAVNIVGLDREGVPYQRREEITEEIVTMLMNWITDHNGHKPWSYTAPYRGRGGRAEAQWKRNYNVEFNSTYRTLKECCFCDFQYEDLHVWQCAGCTCDAPLDIVNLLCGCT